MTARARTHPARVRWTRAIYAVKVALLAALVVWGIAGPQHAQAQSTHDIFIPLITDAPADDSPEAAELVPGRYIVALQEPDAAQVAPAATSVVEEANALAAEYGGQVVLIYESALRGFAGAFPDEAIPALEADPRVAFVEQDQVVKLQTTQDNPTWGLDRIDQRDRPLSQSYTYLADGSGVHAYIVDTGIRASHSEFTGRMGNGVTAINDGNGTNDCHGHGTHVAGTVGGTTYGVAKGVTLHAVRVLNCQGSGFTSLIVAGVDWVTANHISPAVANMSLGGFASNALDTAVRNSIASGVTYAIAAGNSNRNACFTSPARVREALTVGASASNDARASFSNFGICLDIFAPGVDITSAGISSDVASETFSGTSMASPHVAGAAALYLDAFPGTAPAQVAEGLIANATYFRLSAIGFWSPNRLLYTGFIPEAPIAIP